jgi:solute carrier family 45, member 1/2/4
MPEPSTNNDIADGAAKDRAAGTSRRRMTTWDLVNLSISMAGAQIAWTVELGYVLVNVHFSTD